MPQAGNQDRSPPISGLSNLAILVDARQPPDRPHANPLSGSIVACTAQQH